MGLAELFLIAVGLSMDAFAAAVGKGLSMKRLELAQATVIALFFGGFQALMPLAGWALGSRFAPLVEPVDHWIAFALLLAIGGKMVWDALHDGGGADGRNGAPLDVRELLMLAIATSIDALAMGVTLAFLGADIALSAALIGATTFALSLAGVAIGHLFGARWEKPSAIVGGIVLVLIGCKTLLEHLGLLSL